MSKILHFTIILLFLVFGLGLGVFNPHKVDIDLVFLQTQLPLSIIISLSIFIGILMTIVYLGSIIFKLKWQLKKQIKINTKQSNKTVELNSQLIELKKLPTEKSLIPVKELN